MGLTITLIVFLLMGMGTKANIGKGENKYQIAVSAPFVIRLDTVSGNSWMMHMDETHKVKYWVLIKEPYDIQK
jgi:hypothetical protein